MGAAPFRPSVLSVGGHNPCARAFPPRPRPRPPGAATRSLAPVCRRRPAAGRPAAATRQTAPVITAMASSSGLRRFGTREAVVPVRHLDDPRALRGTPRAARRVTAALHHERRKSHPGQLVGAGFLRPARRVQRKGQREHGVRAQFPGRSGMPPGLRRCARPRPRAARAAPARATASSRPASRVFGAGASFLPATRHGCSTSATVHRRRAAPPREPAGRGPRCRRPAPWPSASTRARAGLRVAR